MLFRSEMTLFMRDKLQDIFQATGTTMILVSHDLDEAVYLADEILMLTRRPTRIADRVVFDAPRPRTPATLTADAFNRAKARCLDVFQREAKKIAHQSLHGLWRHTGKPGREPKSRSRVERQAGHTDLPLFRQVDFELNLPALLLFLH